MSWFREMRRIFAEIRRSLDRFNIGAAAETGTWGGYDTQKKTDLVHKVEVIGANVHDVMVVSKQLSGEESKVHSDSGYLGAEKREDAILHNN